MKVIAFDPFLSPERAVELGVEKVELDELLARADIITLHTPLTDKTRNILSRENLAKKCQEGRADRQLRARRPDRRSGPEGRLDSGHIGGAALRRVRRGTAKANRCSARPTSSPPRTWAPRPPRPRRMSPCRWPSRSPTTCSPAPSPTRSTCRRCRPRKRPRLRPTWRSPNGSAASSGSWRTEGITAVSIEVEGAAAQLNIKPITAAVLAGLMRTHSDTVNMVNAPFLAKRTRHRDRRSAPRPRNRLSHADPRDGEDRQRRSRSVAGTLFGNDASRA
jgi:D-3-phosphoglycerate dehydrogenase / 2-oxoglutarate reductase